MVRVVNLEQGMPTVEQARRRLIDEFEVSRRKGDKALKIIHGYGSTGAGGKLRPAIQKALVDRLNRKIIRACVFGENWSIFNAESRQVLDLCDELRNDEDLERENKGITIVVL